MAYTYVFDIEFLEQHKNKILNLKVRDFFKVKKFHYNMNNSFCAKTHFLPTIQQTEKYLYNG